MTPLSSVDRTGTQGAMVEVSGAGGEPAKTDRAETPERPKRPSKLVIAVAAGLLASVVVLAAVAMLTRTPDEAAADRAPANLAAPTVAVSTEQLVERIDVPCRPDADQLDVLVGGVAGVATSGDMVAAPSLVVSDIRVAPGDEVSAGMVLAVVSGRAMIVVDDTVPSHRTLEIGDRGRDVLAVERALVASNLLVTADDVFDEDTATALAGLYQSVGADYEGDVTATTVTADQVVPISGPVAVNAVYAEPGSTLSDGSPLLGLSGASTLLRCEFDQSAGFNPEGGSDVTLAGYDAPGIVERVVAGAPDASGMMSPGYVVVRPPSGSGPESTLAQLILNSSAVDAKVVPVGALFVAADGGVEVRLPAESADGGSSVASYRAVPVTVGLVVAGLAEVDGEIESGDLVQLHGGQSAVGTDVSSGN